MTWSTKINSGKFLDIFRRDKECLKFQISKYLHFLDLNDLNILIYSKTEFWQKYTFKNC